MAPALGNLKFDLDLNDFALKGIWIYRLVAGESPQLIVHKSATVQLNANVYLHLNRTNGVTERKIHNTRPLLASYKTNIRA